MKKQTFALLTLIVLIGLFVSLSACQTGNSENSSEPPVVSDNSADDQNDEQIFYMESVSADCTGNTEALHHFMTTAQSGAPSVLRINTMAADTDPLGVQTNTSIYDQSITFDGDRYRIKTSEVELEYQYFYSVTGRYPNAAADETMYILANEQYSFAQLAEYELSSVRTEEWDYRMVFFSAPTP